MPKRKTITEDDAKAYVQLVKIRFASWVDAGYGDPVAVENWDGNGHWGICWEGAYEWAYYGTTGSFEFEEREPEFGFRLPIVKVPGKLKHIFSEPYNACVVVLYLEDS